MKRKKTKIDKMVYADTYYQKHKADIDKVFGSEAIFKTYVKNSIQQDYYYTKKNARLDIQDLIKAKKGGDWELAYAKRNATNKELYFPDARKLNKKIEEFSAKPSKSSFTDIFGNDIDILQYYEIKGEDVVLANIMVNPKSGSPIEQWEYIDKQYV